MSNLTRIQFLQYGKYANGSTWTTTPGSLKFLRPNNNPTFDFNFTYPERDFQNGLNENFAALRGPQAVAVSDVTVPLYGLSGSGAGDGVDSSTLDTSCSEAIEALTGAAATDNEGDTTDAISPGSGATLTVDAVPGSPVSDGGAVLVKSDTSGKYVAREVVSSSGADYTLDRVVTDDDGNSDSPEASSVVYAGRSFYFDNTNSNPDHLYFDVETEGARHRMYGVYGNGALQFPAGQYASMNLTGLQLTKWDNPAKANPTYSAPTQGNEIVIVDSPLWIGNTQYMAFDFAFDFGVTSSPRRNEGADNGHSGFVRVNSMPKLTGKIRYGALTTPDEITEAAMEALRGSSTFSKVTGDLSVQIGREAGACVYIRMPAAQIKFTKEDNNGQRVLGFEATATESPNQSNVPGACRIHLF